MPDSNEDFLLLYLNQGQDKLSNQFNQLSPSLQCPDASDHCTECEFLLPDCVRDSLRLSQWYWIRPISGLALLKHNIRDDR